MISRDFKVLSIVYESVPLSYNLKMVSWEPNHFSCYVFLINFILCNIVVLDYKLYILLIIENTTGKSSMKKTSSFVNNQTKVSFFNLLY